MDPYPPTSGEMAYSATLDLEKKVEFLMAHAYRDILRDEIASWHVGGSEPPMDLVVAWGEANKWITEREWMAKQAFEQRRTW